MTLTWHNLRERGRIAYGGQTPGANLEQELITAFNHHPGELEAIITRLADRYTSGHIHSPWPLVLREYQALETRLATVSDPIPDRERHADLTENWIRNAGLYEPSEPTLIDAIFGDRGRLKPWTNDPTLRQRILVLYRQERPRAEQAEREMIERGKRWKQQRYGGAGS